MIEIVLALRRAGGNAGSLRQTACVYEETRWSFDRVDNRGRERVRERVRLRAQKRRLALRSLTPIRQVDS